MITFNEENIIVEELLKKSPHEITQKIYIVNEDGSRSGPYIKKVFNKDSGLGNAYLKMNKCSKFQENNEFIPRILNTKINQDKLIVIEEFFNGITLDEYIKNKNFSYTLIKDIFSNLCMAVNILHKNFDAPIIHRDIKPSNILVSSQEKLKLIDFGISRNYDDEQFTDTYKFGTVGYAPPEQFGFQQTDVRSDIYSLGKVLEFLCNENNWKEKSNTRSKYKFQDIINKACSFDPKKRYKSVDDLLNDFNKAQIYNNKKWFLIIGHIWNLFVCILLFMSMFTAFGSFLTPGKLFNYSFFEKVLYIIMLICFIAIPSWFIMLYKPSIRMFYPQLPKFKIWQYAILVMLCFAFVMLIAAITSFLK